jgi:hypothetical protein
MIFVDKVIASAKGGMDTSAPVFMQTWDVRQSLDLAYAFFAHDTKGVRFGLEFADVNGQCDGPGSRDLTYLLFLSSSN